MLPFFRRVKSSRPTGASGTLCDVHGAAADLASPAARGRQLVLRRHQPRPLQPFGILVLFFDVMKTGTSCRELLDSRYGL